MLRLVTHFLSSTIDIIFTFLIKKTLIHAQNQKPQKTIFQTPRVNNHVLAKPLLYLKTLKASL